MLKLLASAFQEISVESRGLVMLKQIHAFDKLMTASKSIMSEIEFSKLLATQYDQLKTCVRKVAFTVDECSDAMSAIRDISHFSKAQKEEFSCMLGQLLSNGDSVSCASSSGETKTQNQTHEFIECYLTADDWGVLMNASNTSFSKIDTLVRRCLSIGLKYPTEGTTKLAVALLLATAKDEPSSREAYELLQAFKTKLKQCRANYPSSFIAPNAYPANVLDFASSTNAFAAQPPIASMIGSEMIRYFAHRVPARKSNGALQQQQQQGKQLLDPTNNSANLMSMLLNLAQQVRVPTHPDVRLTMAPSLRKCPSSSLLLDQPPVPQPDTPPAIADAGDAQPNKKSLSEVIKDMQGATQAASAKRGEPKTPTPKKKQSPKKPTPKTKPAPKQPSTVAHKIHTVTESKTKWAAGVKRLGAGWVNSKERKSLIEMMPASEKKRRRMQV